MYEGTGDPRYLRRVKEHFDAILANRDDRHNVKDQVRNKVMPLWSTTRYSRPKRYSWIVHAGMITFPIARWVYLVNYILEVLVLLVATSTGLNLQPRNSFRTLSAMIQEHGCTRLETWLVIYQMETSSFWVVLTIK